ncbi:dihydrofolate reductase family protein [Zhihengliuella sp.]|uniref:dihydrofolate reductase family protein n=1 Tax=Zhihengliuella sp. TaxID=1954483 RepID=UPI0028115BE2|nr:dihydrofolate reductase family protein [Zhihengliuella sp.]
MRRLFLHTNVSLDGFINDDSGAIDWAFSDAEFERHLDELLQSIDGMVFGRVAHDELAAYWPTAGDEVTAVQRERMHALPKYVLSSTLEHSDWHRAVPLGPDAIERLRSLKQEDGRDIAVFAGGSAATSLLESDLLDELRLVLNPVLLGKGTRLFQGGQPRSRWEHKGTKTFASGAVLLTYSRR